MKREQKIVAAGAASGVASMLVAMYLLLESLPVPAGMDDLAGRIAFALRCLALAAVPLFATFAAVGNARFLGDAIDPTRGAESRTMLIDGRVADNSFQQFVLFTAASLALAASLPPERMNLILAAAIIFVAARFLFWIGYRIDPLYRAFGFAATAYLNLGLLIAALWLALR
jgi:uncharacterized MAPEG superfamily protein